MYTYLCGVNYFIMKKILFFAGGIILLLITYSFSCDNPENYKTDKSKNMSENKQLQTATLANGCFWCTEAVFQQLEGVEKVTSGYSGGNVKNPTYEEVCKGNTGHAECLKIEYDPSKISFDELLEVFWETHDPTTLNRQGNDIGPQYRSVVFYQNEEQKNKAEKYKAELDKSGAFDKPIVTAIEPFTVFYPAENYHKDYYQNNKTQPYCYYVIRPKLEKLKKVFADKLKTTAQ